jgi:hypothetical protein
MTHKKGTHLGGIATVEDIRRRCRVDEDTGCWHWLMAQCEGVPRLHYWHPTTNERKTGKGRRVALVLARGSDLPKGHIAWEKNCCGSADCVNPAHSRHGTKTQWGEWLAATGRVKDLPSKCAGARRGWEKRGRKITPEGAQLIMTSFKSQRELAEELGVSQYAIWCVRQGNCHLPTMRNASVWTWGGL